MDNTIYYIYKLTSPNGKCYIGLTCDLNSRWSQHRTNADNPERRFVDRKLYKAIRKYGFDNFNKEWIFSCFSLEDAKHFEILFVSKYNSFHRGYNMTEGGDSGTTTKYFDDETMKELTEQIQNSKLSLTQLGKEYGVSLRVLTRIKNTYNGGLTRHNFSINNGEGIGNSKLTEESIKEMLTLYSDESISLNSIAEKFGICVNTINDIIKGKTWNHLSIKIPKRRKHRGNSSLIESQVREIWELSLKGLSTREISNETNQKYHTVYAVLSGKNWKDIHEEYTNKKGER